jgi:16S rRNA (cytosine967-C5)-methyltransferase
LELPLNPISPRRLAFDILARIEKEHSYADLLLDQTLSHADLIGPDRGLLTELVYGTLRRQGTLDHLIDQFATQKTQKLERAVLILLRLGLYQLLFLDRVPVRAAVHETVEMAKDIAPRAAGMINAILRRTDRERGQLPFPDPGTQPVAYLAARHGHPRWICALWLDQLGLPEAEELARAMAEQAPFTLRTNTLCIDREDLLDCLTDAGAHVTPTRWSPLGIQLAGGPPLTSLPCFRDGHLFIQDEASQLAGLLLTPRPGESVLDLCAAPGGKTTLLAQLMENRGEIVACDRHQRKLRLITENADRLGVTTITPMSGDACLPLPALAGHQFDRILVDAPCSGLGVIRRNPEGKWWKSREDLDRLAVTQRQILATAADYLKAGGTLVYATCSTSTIENEEVVGDFLSSHPDFVIEPVQQVMPELAELATPEGFFRSWPHRQGMDGFFAARMKKTT